MIYNSSSLLLPSGGVGVTVRREMIYNSSSLLLPSGGGGWGGGGDSKERDDLH